MYKVRCAKENLMLRSSLFELRAGDSMLVPLVRQVPTYCFQEVEQEVNQDCTGKDDRRQFPFHEPEILKGRIALPERLWHLGSEIVQDPEQEWRYEKGKDYGRFNYSVHNRDPVDVSLDEETDDNERDDEQDTLGNFSKRIRNCCILITFIFHYDIWRKFQSNFRC